MAISYFLRVRDPKKINSKDHSIYLRYNQGGEKYLVWTGLSCSTKDWKYKIKQTSKAKDNAVENKEQWLSGSPRVDSLDDALSSFKKKFNRNAVHPIGDNAAVHKVKEAWESYLKSEKDKLPEAVFKNSLLSSWKEYIDYLKETLSVNGRSRAQRTIWSNESSREKFESFLKEHNRQTTKADKFTFADFQKFDKYLVKKYKPNTVSKAKKHFKAFLKWYIQQGGQITFDISRITYKENAGVKISLSEKELSQWAHASLDGDLFLARDYSVLQASTGVRISDLKRLCDHINDERNAFRIKMRKTGKAILVPILPLAKEVLERNNYQIPEITEQSYRQGIKAIYKKLWPDKTVEIGDGDNIKKVFVHEEISSHDMVRTFVNIAAKKGISVPSIAVITGKSIQVLLKNYLSEDKEHAAKELMEKFDVSPLKIAK